MAQLGSWRATYTPGRWVVLAGPSALVIMPPAPASASTLLNDLWDDVLASASMPELVERLASFRVDQLPSFAALFWHGDQLRSLMRGAVHAIDLATGARVAEGADVVTWVEAGLGDVTQVRIDLEPVDQDQVLQLPLVTGVVTASAVVLDATAAPSSVQLTPQAVASPPVAVADADTDDGAAPADRPVEGSAEVATTDDGMSVAADPAAALWGTPEVPDWARESVPEPGTAADEPVVDPVATNDGASAVEGDPTEQLPSVPAAAAEPMGTPQAEDDAPVDDTQLMSAGDRPGGNQAAAPSPWGAPPAGFATGLPPVPGVTPAGPPPGFPSPQQQPHPGQQTPAPNPFAAPPPPGHFGQSGPHERPGQQPASEAQSYGRPHHQPGFPPAPGAQPYGQPPQSAPFPPPPSASNYGQPPAPHQPGWPPPQPSPGPDPAHAPHTPHSSVAGASAPGTSDQGLISAVPNFAGSNQPSPASAAGDEADHDGATIFQTGLARALKSAPAGAGRDESFVLAAVCVQQHPNPPGATQCRLCSSPVPQQNPRLVARPVLATLRPSSGSAIEVDRNVLIGRAPSASRVARDQLPHLLTVPSPSHDISRTHVQVHPDEWNIVVTDLHSTNGTTLVHPGGDERERLTPGEPVIVQIGSVLDLGDGITVLVDAP